jgi:hypothetical protein
VTQEPRFFKLHPEELVREFDSLAAPEFARRWDDTMMLLVRIDDPASELCEWLASTAGAGDRGVPLAPSRDGIPFATNLAEVATLCAARKRPRVTASAIVADLDHVSYFITPLRKRASEGKPFTERISVGRAPNNDIILRHPSVSKFHAWFECDDDNVIYLHDAKSTNRTLIAGEIVPEGEARTIVSGVEIMFGEVACIACSPAMIRDIVGRL